LLLWLADGPPASAPDAERPAAPAGLSWIQADELDRKLHRLEKRFKKGEAENGSMALTEGEINSYVNLTLASDLPQGVSDLRVRLERDRVLVRGRVDMEKVKERVQMPSGGFSPLALLGGEVPIEVEGRIASPEQGFGSFEVEAVRIASVPVPSSLVEQLVAQSTRKPSQPEGFDLRSPFRLPYSLKRLRIQPGRALLDF
jgi:hypothetical protein